MTAWHRPVRLQISYAAIAQNTRLLSRILGPNVQIMAPVKANAYGHGAVQTARTVLCSGAQRLAVATVDEAMELRQAGIEAPILILGASYGEAVECAVACSAALSIQSLDQLQAVAQAATHMGKTALIHLQVDTGMTRLGVQGDETLQTLLSALHTMPQVRMEGIYTHFFDANDDAVTRQQFARFLRAVSFTRQAGFTPLVHCAATEAALRFPEMRCDCVRPGIALYGGCAEDLPGSQWAMQLSARPVRVAHVEAGETVGYGGTFRLLRPSTIMTVPIGYADGYPRILGGRAQVLVRGMRAPVIGRVCMDMLMVDVTDIPGVTMDDPIVLMGSQGQETITPEDLAFWANTISYEIITGFHDRIARGDFDDKRTDSANNPR